MFIMAALVMLCFYIFGGKGHSIDLDSARLIYKCSDFYKRRITESTMINSFPNMNISACSFRLNDFFNRIILSNIEYKCWFV